MTSRSLRMFLVCILVVCACFLLVPISAGAASPHSSPAISSVTLHQDPARIRAYWTVARMQSAHSADTLVVRTQPIRPAYKDGDGTGIGAPTLPTYRHHLAAPDSSPVSQNSYGGFPYSTVGKVFFTDSRTNTNYVCSGSAVTSANKSVVDTAGHCIIQGGSGNNWYTNWQFCPQYYNGSSPYGCWSARQLYSTNAWATSGSLQDDFGDAVVSNNSYGALVSVVGGAGYTYGVATSQTFTALGYPQAAPFNGSSIYQCGPTKPSTVTGYGNGTVLAIPCDMTGGASGGPWFISVNGSFGYINGHNDFKYNNDSGHMYSPYYTSEWFQTFNSAQNS